MKKIHKTFRVNAPGDVAVYTVSGPEIRSVYTDWIGGSHWYADPKLVPKGEIWIESMKSKQDEKYILAHEMAEYPLMKYLRFSYDKAHAAANVVEKKLRNGHDPVSAFLTHLQTYWPKAPAWQLRKGALAFAAAYRGY
jgi:hypothetical protein